MESRTLKLLLFRANIIIRNLSHYSNQLYFHYKHTKICKILTNERRAEDIIGEIGK